MIDKKELKLENFLISDKIKKIFEDNNFIYYYELEGYDYKKMKDKFKLSFSVISQILYFLDYVKTIIDTDDVDGLNEIYCVPKESIEVNNEEEVTININISSRLDEINLTVRTYNALTDAGYKTVEDIIKLSYYDFFNIKNMGKKSADEIYNIVENIKVKNGISSETIDDKSYYVNSTIDELNLSVRTYNALTLAGYKTVEDIINLSYYDFMHIKNMGKKSVDEIYNKIQSIKSGKDELFDVFNNEIFDTYKYKEKKIVEFNEIPDLKGDLWFDCDYPNITFNDFYLISKTAFTEKKIINGDLNKIISFLSDCIIIPNNEKLDLKERERDFIIRRANGETLEKIGKDNFVTRERVRQLVKNGIEKVSKYWKIYKIQNVFLDDYYFSDQNTTFLNDEDYILYLITLPKNADYVCIKSDNKRCYVKKQLYIELQTKVNKLKNDLDSKGFLLNDEYDNSLFNNFVSLELMKKFNIVKNDYCIYVSDLDNTKITYYVKRYGVIDLQDPNLPAILEKYLDVKSEINRHSLLAVFYRNNIIACGKQKYTFDEEYELSADVIVQITDFINEKGNTDFFTILEKFKDKLPKCCSGQSLYYKFKSMYPTDFKYLGPTFSVSRKDLDPSKASSLYSYLKEATKPILKLELMEKFNINLTSIWVIITQNKDILLLDDSYVWLFSKMKNVDGFNRVLLEYISTKKSFLISDVFNYFYNRYTRWMSDNFITTSQRLLRYMKIQLKDYLAQYKYNRFLKEYRKPIEEIKVEGFDDDF